MNEKVIENLNLEASTLKQQLGQAAADIIAAKDAGEARLRREVFRLTKTCFSFAWPYA